MKTKHASTSCSRSWEIAAVRDGRLGGLDEESLLRHLASCSVCAAERDELEALAASLQRLPRLPLDDLAARRIRQRVLTDHNAWMLRQDQPAPRTRRYALVAAGLGVLLTLALWGLLGRREKALRARPPMLSVDVVASEGARFRRESSPHSLRVALDEGVLRLTIRRDDASDRVTIALPDGEIEDRGTVLDVAVSGGRTRRVDVERGSVVLHLQSAMPLTLTAGESWRRAPDEADAMQAPLSAKPNPIPTVRPPAASRSERPASAAGHPGARLHHERSSAGGTSGLQTSPDPTSAIAQEPTAKAEDDAYLHIVELAQQGRVEETRAAARDYLVRFPGGFRRLEVLNIATHPAP